jgi:hypothetical protein
VVKGYLRARFSAFFMLASFRQLFPSGAEGDKFKKSKLMNLLNERGTRWENHAYVMRGALPQPLALETEHGDAMPEPIIIP